MPAKPPLRPGKRSDNLPVISKEAPWLFVQPVERRLPMERLVRSVLAALSNLRPHPPAPDSPITWLAR